MINSKMEIRNFTPEALREALIQKGYPSYRTLQLLNWIYKKDIKNFSQIKNMPKATLDFLEETYCITSPKTAQTMKSKDGSVKFLLELKDGKFIETVLIPSFRRLTICISTQVGCKFNCLFCASGKIGFVRDLETYEIINQILHQQANSEDNITNYVFMGMGEPLDNFENLKKALLIMASKDAMNIGSRRITVSTCGIPDAIKKLSQLGLQINLSVSLHAADDILRNKLVPINKRYPIKELIKACKYFFDKTGRLITIEYVMLDGINDTQEQAYKLLRIAKEMRAKVNLIPCSKNDNFKYSPSNEKNINLFGQYLSENNINVTLRRSKGADIQAACGQLAGKRIC